MINQRVSLNNIKRRDQKIFVFGLAFFSPEKKPLKLEPCESISYRMNHVHDIYVNVQKE